MNNPRVMILSLLYHEILISKISICHIIFSKYDTNDNYLILKSNSSSKYLFIHILYFSQIQGLENFIYSVSDMHKFISFAFFIFPRIFLFKLEDYSIHNEALHSVCKKKLDRPYSFPSKLSNLIQLFGKYFFIFIYLS